MKGIIYLVTNLINDKKYVGQTCVAFEYRKRKHLKHAFVYYSQSKFYEALRKYGQSNFKWIIIEEIDDLNLLNERETYWIEYYDSFNNGYNMTLGGDSVRGYHHTEESKQKIKDKMKGKNNLVHFINRYGEIDGTKIYQEYITKMKDRKGKKRLDLLIQKYGEIDGKIKYDHMINNIKAARKENGAVNTLDYFIKKYGDIEGKQKYLIFSNKMKNKKDTDLAKKKKSNAKMLYWQNKKGEK